MGEKRPSRGADPAALERAVELRKAGKKYREIAAEVGITIGPLCQHFKKLGLAAAVEPEEVNAEQDADDAEAADESDAIRADALAGARAALAAGESRAADTLTKVAERMVKLSRLLRGRGPSRGASGAPGNVVQVNVLTPAEARVVDGLGGGAP